MYLGKESEASFILNTHKSMISPLITWVNLLLSLFLVWERAPAPASLAFVVFSLLAVVISLLGLVVVGSVVWDEEGGKDVVTNVGLINAVDDGDGDGDDGVDLLQCNSPSLTPSWMHLWSVDQIYNLI